MIDKTQIRHIIWRLQHNGWHDIADHVWDLLDAYNELDVELTLKFLDTPTEQQTQRLITAAYQHSEISDQEILGCLSHYFDNAANRLLRCQNHNDHHHTDPMHTHRLNTTDGAVHLYIWDENEAFTTLKSITEHTP